MVLAPDKRAKQSSEAKHMTEERHRVSANGNVPSSTGDTGSADPESSCRTGRSPDRQRSGTLGDARAVSSSLSTNDRLSSSQSGAGPRLDSDFAARHCELCRRNGPTGRREVVMERARDKGTEMPKQKTDRGAVARFKITDREDQAPAAEPRHLLEKKSSVRTRRLATKSDCPRRPQDVRRLLGI